MKTIIIIIGAVIYLSVLLCAVAYHTSLDYRGHRKSSIALDILWPVSYVILYVYIGAMKTYMYLETPGRGNESKN